MKEDNQYQASPQVDSAHSRQQQPRRFRCDHPGCQLTFTRIDHLKRHHLRHSGIKPYTCIFCQITFARCDSLRNHYSECTARGDRPIPETDQKGRRRHSCLLCMNMKLKCTGETHQSCTSCAKRGVPCVRPDTPTTSPGTPSPGRRSSTTVSPVESAPSVDMESIRSCLHGGQDGFVEDMSLPGQISSPYQYPVTVPTTSPINVVDMSQYRDAVNSFYQGPFDAYHLQWQESISGMRSADTPWLVTRNMPPVSCDYPIYTEQQHPSLALLLDALVLTLRSLGLGMQRQQELHADLQFMLVPQRCRHFQAMYQKMWHPNAPIIHNIGAFTFEAVPPQLLAAVLLMGAMYSFDSRELAAAKDLLDLVETYIFSSELFAPDAEIRRAMLGAESEDAEVTDWVSFQILQAAHLNIIVQHWAGNKLARERSMEVRYGQLLRVVRNMKITNLRHTEAEAMHQQLWIEQESKIRTVHHIICLDYAFVFFHNFPPRTNLAELDRDLPCEHSLFESAQPFAEPNFRLRRNMTLRQAYELLFDAGGKTTEQLASDLTLFDMWLLIHVLYMGISDRLLLRVPFNAATPAQPSKNPLPDPLMAAPLTALAKWRSLWDHVRAATPQEVWARSGFFRDALRYWLVARLVADRHGRVSGAWLLEPRCGDKLERLHALAG